MKPTWLLIIKKGIGESNYTTKVANVAGKLRQRLQVIVLAMKQCGACES